MSRRDKLIALAERVEALDGPDREVDCAIGVAIGLFRTEPNRGWPGQIDYIQIREEGDLYPGHGFDQLVPKYSASLDAAMSLLPVIETPGDPPRHADFIIECTNAGLTIAAMVGHDGRDRCSWGATPALVLTAAALRALAEQEQWPTPH